MKVKRRVIGVLMFLLLFSCAATQLVVERMYPGEVINRSSRIVDAAFVNMAAKKMVAGKMLSPGEIWALELPAGLYFFVASSSAGYFKMDLRLPEGLKDPNGVWHITLWDHKPRRM